MMRRNKIKKIYDTFSLKCHSIFSARQNIILSHLVLPGSLVDCLPWRCCSIQFADAGKCQTPSGELIPIQWAKNSRQPKHNMQNVLFCFRRKRISTDTCRMFTVFIVCKHEVFPNSLQFRCRSIVFEYVSTVFFA